MGFDKHIFATNMKIERLKRGWKQADLAKESGVSISSIARYEMEENIPTLDTATLLAGAFGVSIDALCSEDALCERKVG